jgi:hypothetical protein
MGDTIEEDGRRMKDAALDGLRVAKVWVSTLAAGPEPPETRPA